MEISLSDEYSFYHLSVSKMNIFLVRLVDDWSFIRLKRFSNIITLGT